MPESPTSGDPATTGNPLPGPLTETLLAKVIAFYLPQFHVTAENNQFWGAGYSEWTAVARARKYFRGHIQPRIPGELGFYDLRLPETRESQANLARDYGVHGFCYWHYWFEGRRVLHRPFEEVLKSGHPDLPFCLGWANHSWNRAWEGKPGSLLIEQTYPGATDDRRHFDCLEAAFHDPRYIHVQGAPLLFIFRPNLIPDLAAWLDRWRSMAQASGLPGLTIVGQLAGSATDRKQMSAELNAVVDIPVLGTPEAWAGDRRAQFHHKLRVRLANGRFSDYARPVRVDYRRVSPTIPRLHSEARCSYPAIVPNWDCTPRRGRKGVVLTGDTAAEFGRQVELAVSLVKERAPSDRIIFLKSWNEWAEGNYIEPDWETGRARLAALANAIQIHPKAR